MSTAWSSVSRHVWCRKHTSARCRRGAAILRTRSADAVRTLWNRIRGRTSSTGCYDRTADTVTVDEITPGATRLEASSTKAGA